LTDIHIRVAALERMPVMETIERKKPHRRRSFTPEIVERAMAGLLGFRAGERNQGRVSVQEGTATVGRN
jgi:hypothetical protein